MLFVDKGDKPTQNERINEKKRYNDRARDNKIKINRYSDKMNKRKY
jgi:hypothetical protein